MAVSIEEVSAVLAPPAAEPQSPEVVIMPTLFDPEPIMRLMRREQSRTERRSAN